MKKNLKLLATSLLAVVGVAGLAGCNPQGPTTEKEIVVWAPGEEEPVINAIVEEYNKTSNEKIKIAFKNVQEGDGGTILAQDPEVANRPALVAVADDHIFNLVQKGVISPLKGARADWIKENNTPLSVDCASKDGVVYGYPISTDNGYFLWYDTRDITDEDAKTLEGVMAKCSSLKKTFLMDVANGWYVNAFPQAQGVEGPKSLSFTVDAEGTAHYNIPWDSDASAKAIKAVSDLNLVTNPNTLVMGSNDAIAAGFSAGTMSAAVSGTWMENILVDAIGKENVGAVKLPTFAVDGVAHQMASFTGSKIYVINKYAAAEDQKAAADLAKLLTNKEGQITRFKLRNALPCNVEAVDDPEYLNNISVGGKALVAQNEFAAIQSQSAEGRYWDVGKAIGQAIYDGKLSDGDKGGSHTVEEWKAFLKVQCDSIR